ncbi:MAG: DUF4398 domain-containing protein [Polyangiaceae bacterium]
MKITIAAALIPILAVACSSYPAPTARMATSTSAVRAAHEVNADKDPQAALHLKLAQEELDQAKQQMDEGDNKRAEFTLLRADADGELAVALARASQAKTEAAKSTEDLKKK